MSDVTRILAAIEQGDPSAAEQLLPLVYEELRKLAAQRLGQEKPGQTLQATALVHEAYLRLVGGEAASHWNSRGHFFAAAAEAMRRILVENARGKARAKRGGDWRRVDFEDLDVTTCVTPEQLVALDDALETSGLPGPSRGTTRQVALFCRPGSRRSRRVFGRFNGHRLSTLGLRPSVAARRTAEGHVASGHFCFVVRKLATPRRTEG